MKPFEPIPSETERVAKVVVNAAFQVHKELGPGLLESVYEACLLCELKGHRMQVETQVAIPVVYKEMRLDVGLRLDMLVEKQVLVELKAVEAMIPLFDAQLLSYLKLTKQRLGLLINFNVPLIKHGIKRIIL